jgi:chromosome segregation ATPase
VDQGIEIMTLPRSFAVNHRHLKVDLSPGVNFVVGKNGSGKSAIVMALQAGLGCMASASGRTSNTYKNNIMNGCDTALVKIMIAYADTDPFKHEEFGETIVVERRLGRHGPGSYHLSDVIPMVPDLTGAYERVCHASA